MLGEKTKIMSIHQILNEGQFIVKCKINEINIIQNLESGKLFLMNSINIKQSKYHSNSKIINNGHIIILGPQNNEEMCILYTGRKNQNIKNTVINIESKYIGEENSIFEIVNCVSLYASQFISRGTVYCHHSLSIHQNISNEISIYGKVAAQNKIIFFSIIRIDLTIIRPILEGKEKIFIIKSLSELEIFYKFNTNLNVIFQTKKLINRSCIISNSITIKTGDFTNFGQISSSNDIDINCANFTNNSGRIEAHGNINIKANKYSINKGGEKLKKNCIENVKVFDMVKSQIHIDEKTKLYSNVELIEKNVTVTKNIYHVQFDKCGVITTDNGVVNMHSETIDNSFGIISSKNGILINGEATVINEYGLIYSGDYIKIISSQFKNGYRKESEIATSFDPNRPKIRKQCLMFPNIDVFNEYEGAKKFQHYLQKENGNIPVIADVDFIFGYNESPLITENQGYLFAQNDINIFSDTDIFLGTIVSKNNITIKGESISSINFLDRGKIIANGDVLLEMKRCSIDQARIQANNIVIMLMENLTINGIIQPVLLLDGSVVLILDLKKFAQIIGIFNKNPEMARKMLDFTENSLKKRDSSGFIGEKPFTENFISSLPDKKMQEILDFILTPIKGRHVLQNENIIKSLEYSGATSDSTQLEKIDKPMILYQKSNEKQVIYDDKGNKQYIAVYDPQLILNSLNKVVSFLDAQKKISIQSMKNIHIMPGKFEVNSDLSLEAEEKITLLPETFTRVTCNQVDIQSGHELTISGEKGVETKAVKINSQKINIISSNGDIRDESVSLKNQTITSEMCAQDKISIKGKNIKLTGTNILSGSGGIEFTAENVDLNPTYKTFCSEKQCGNTHVYQKYKIVQPMKIETAGNIEFNAKKVNIISSNIFANSIKNNVNGDFNISAVRDHAYYHSYYEKDRFFGSCSREQTVTNDVVRPTEIVSNEIQSFGVGDFKIESAIIKAANMFISKNLIENTLEDEYYNNIVCKRKGFFPPKINTNPIKVFSSHKLDIIIEDLSILLFSTFTTSAVYSNMKTTFDQKQKIPVQSNVKLGVLLFKNNRTHLEGIWEIDRASIETDTFTAKSPNQTEVTNYKEKGFHIDFSPAGVLTSIFYPCSLIPTIIPSMNLIKNKDSVTKIDNCPMKLNANNLLIRCNDAIFSGSQIRSKVVDAIINGKLTIESLTNLFERKIKNTKIGININSIYNSVLTDKIPETLFGKFKSFPSIRVANKKVLEKKVDAIAQLIGTEYFYLKVAEFSYTQPSIIGLEKEGSYAEKRSENEVFHIDKKECKIINNEHYEKNKVINPSIHEIVNVMGKIDHFRRSHSNTIKTALYKSLKIEEISKIDNGIRDFFNDTKNVKCIQELNKNIKNIKESVNNISSILYDFSEEKNMPKEISNTIDKQIHNSLNYGTMIRQKHEKFLKKNIDMKEIYENSISSISSNIINELVEVSMIFCKDSLYKYQQRFAKICQSKNMKCALIEQFPDKIVDYAISHAKNEKEAIEFSKTMLYGFKNITQKSNEMSYNIKNPEIYARKLDTITENIKEKIDNEFNHREKLRDESIQSISEFLNQEVLKTIKFFPT